MAESGNSLRCDFTDLGKFQQAHSLVYTVSAVEGDSMYSFCVEAVQKGRPSKKYQVTLHTAAEEANQLLHFLYENGVDVGQARDILHDLGL